MNMPSIEINNLSKQFKNTLAVKNISFKIHKGEIIGLLGPNGSGKSTTMGMLLGLIKPTSGNVMINGQNIENNRTNIITDQPGRIFAVFVFSPLLILKGIQYDDLLLHCLGASLLTYDLFWLVY